MKIWHYKWFINDHTTFAVKNPFKTLKNVQLPVGLFAHIWNMLCEIHFVINLHTEYFHSFCWRYCCILNIYHPTINITTMGWNQHCLEFYRISLQIILFKPVHKNNNVLSNVINCVTKIRNTVIIGIVVDVTTTMKKEYIFYREHILLLSITSLRFCHIVSLLKCW